MKKINVYDNWLKLHPISIIFMIGFTLTFTLVAPQSLTETPKYFTIFDSVGEMASGMAYVHVAIPLNLSTFQTQAGILEDYLFKLSRVVDSDNEQKNNFLQNVREIASFAQVKLERLKNRMLHLDQILPYDGDLTQQRQKRTALDTLNDDEIINYEQYLHNYTHNPIELKDIVTNQNSLKHKHDHQLRQQLTLLKLEHEKFIKNAQINNKHRFKRQTPIMTRTAEYSLVTGLSGLIGTFNYTFDHTSQYQKQIAKEYNMLQEQQYRITQIRNQITTETEEMSNKLEGLTQQKWSPSMDKIIGRQNFDMLHEDIKAFQFHLSKTFPEEQYNDRNHRTSDINTDNNDTQTNSNITQTNKIPIIYHKIARNKRSFEINDKNTFIDFNGNYTIRITEEYRQLQMDINELIIQTLADLKENINTSRRLKGYTKMKSEGTKTEFFRFEDIFKETPNSTTTRDNNTHRRVKRVAPLVVAAGISGILGTFLGMYNTWEIKKLKDRLNEADKNHNMLVHVTERQEEQVHRITENMNAICLLIKLMASFNPALIAEQLSAQISLLEMRLTMATNAVQQLQHRRLSVDFLDTWQLEQMHTAVSEIAKERGYTLMPQRVSDYFQVETSYLRNGKDILIMLHVPCIAHDQLLTIYKYIPLPFPIPKFVTTDSTTIADLINQRAGEIQLNKLEDMDALTIVPEAEMIAVSSNDKFQILTQSDLAACIKRNKIYLCENHQVLHTDLTNSCLGSIYSNYEKGIKENCQLIRRKLVETVYQLSPTNYLIFTPAPYKATIECKTGINLPVFLTQIYKLHVPEDCFIRLKSHLIQSDFNIRISPEPLNVPWSLDPMQLPADILLDAALIDNKIKELDINLRQLLNETSKKTDFQAMLNIGLGSPGSYPWFVWMGGITSVTALFLLAFWYIYNSVQHYKQQKQYLTGQQNPTAPQIITDPMQHPHSSLYPKFNL